MIRQTKQVWRSRLNSLLLMVALLLCPAVLHAQTNQLDFSDTTEISAGAPGIKITIFGLFPINKGIQTPMCFFTVPGTSGTPLIPLKGDFSSSTLVELQIPAGSIQEIPASAFSGGVFNATAYATANTTDTCDGKFDAKYTTSLQIPIQEPAVLGTDLDTLTARNTNLSVNPAPREIYLQGTDFVSKEAAVTFSGSGFSSFAGAVTVVSPISARVDVPANLPAGAKFVDLTYCTHTATADYCASPVTYPIQQLANNPGTLTATPSPTTPTTSTALQAVFGSTDGFGVPSGLVTFTDGTTTLGTAPLAFTSGQFVATNPSSAAPGEFEGSPKSILADLNQDGLQDVILYAPNTIQIYYAADNLGGLGFAGSGFGFTGVEFALDNDFCSSVVSVTTGDFNGDGYPDIAMLCVDPAGTGNNVLVYLNQQDGTFGREAAIFPAPPAHLIAAADFDKDGNTDILLVGPDGNTDPNGSPLTGFNIYPGDGFGDFGNSTPIDVPLADGVQVAAVDFNSDGFPDIALLYHDFTVELSSSQMEVFQNDGKGNFPVTPTYQQSLGDSGATFQFFTPTLPGSKYPNIVAVNGGTDASIAVVFNNQTPTIGFSDTIFTTPVPGLLTAAMGDFNGDGFQDVAVYDGSNLSVYNAGPTGLYNQPIDSLTLSTSINLLVGSSDANGDGYSDPIAFITPSDGPRLVQQYITSGTATATLPNLTFAAGSHSLTATTPGTPTLAPGTATATLVSNGPTQIPVSNAVLTTSPTSPTTYAPSNPVTLTAEVDSANPPAPTGQISFFNAQTSTLLGTANLTATSSTKSSASLPIGTLTAGGYTFSATYPGDTTYLPTTLPSATLIVNKATPVVGFVPNPATITFGTALSGAQLDATATLSGSPVAGSFVYTNASGTVVDTTTVLPGGSNNITATFTPSDTTDYKTPASVTSTITVNKATPVVAFVPNPATLPSGAPLTAAQLDATATFGGSAVPGSFVYTNASGTVVNVGTVLPAGANVITASFTPSNTTNFNVPAGVAATITLNAATTTLTFAPNPATITFGTALSAAQLDATATSGGSPVAGTFVYTNASGTVVNTTTILPAGSNAITVNFTPSDTTSFTTPAAVTSSITVNKATPTVSWATPAAIPFGTALSGTQLNATASFNGSPVAGTFSYNPASGTVLTAGTHTLGVTFTPTDGADFNVATGSTSISVGQATPTITWATPAAISYGTALSATQLNATATFNGTAVAGTFNYNAASGTVLTAGTHTLGVTFTPTDTTDFTTATGSVSITVSQSTPTITWATPASISFGTALSGTQLNATATFNGTAVAGTFSYNPAAGTVLAAGTHTLGVTFTPTDTTDFAVATGSVSITVGQSTPTITWATPAAISYGTALSGTQLNATATFNGTAVAGTFSYNPASGTVLTAGSHTLGVTFTPTDTTDFTVTTGSVSITVGQSTPTITWATPATISYGTALSGTQLNATATFNGTAVAGTFSYNPASGTVLTAGTHTLGVTFTPTDTTDFTVATGSVSITVGQSTPTITWATPAAIPYGTALSATQLNATATFNGTAVAGTFSYNPASGTVLTAGPHTLGVTFTPTDGTDFTVSTGSVSITVGQSTPIITWATPAAISYGTALSGTQLNATATFNATAVAGTFTYNPVSGTVLTAGTHALGVTFTPTDTTDFTVATGSVNITVGQSTPIITWATPAPISYGTALSATQLNATATFNGSPVAGSFSYNPAAGTVLTAGTHTLGVTFTPTDGTDFTVATGSVSITVGQSTPTITWPTPAAISYGTALSGTQLNATATFNGTTVAGTFSYNPASGTVLTAGSHTLGVTFTPTDATDFTVATGSVNITVGQSTPTITWATPSAISYGTALSATQLNATVTFNGTAVAGTFSYNPASGTVLTAGSHTLGVTFTPTDATDFTVATGSISITVGQSTPIITWATPAAISFGTALSATQLNATATFNGTAVAGTFTYNPASGTVLTAGSHALGVTFTPTDTTDFTVATGSVNITVGQSTPTITWATPAAISFGTALSATQLNATATFNGTTVAGTFSYNPASGTVLTAGSHALGVTFTPTDATDFTAATGSVNITVGQSTPTITWATPAAISYGTALSGTQLNANATFNGTAVAGTFSYNPASGTVLTAGTHSLGVTFTPTDTTDFTVATGSVNITVGQSTPTITWATPAAISYGTALSATQLNATATFNGTAVAGTFSYNPASGTVLTAGSHTLGVTFTPTDTTDFTVATGSVSITVGQSTPVITWATPAAISYGTALSGTQLNATATFNGTAVAGTFNYNPASGTVLTAGAHSLGVTFTPTDTADFTVATGSTNIAVGQDTPVILWTPPAAINLGTALGAAQLSASATGVGGTALAGTFTYLPAAGAVLPVGANSLGVTFTPTDAVDYKTATASVPLTVNPAVTTTTVTPSANPAQFGQLVTFTVGVTSAYTGAAITGPVSVFDGQTLLGTVQLPNVTVSTSALSAGAHSITAVYGGSTNFGSSSSAILTDTISSATTTITWPTPASVPYGTKLSATQLNATVSTAFAQTVPGTFTYTPAAGALLTAGSQTLSVLFTPTDTASFKTASATVTLVVTKIAPTLNWATPANITAGTPLGATQLNATATDIGGNPLPGVFTYTPASGAILAPGATTLSAAFAPTDTVDYTTANISVPLNVDPAVATIAVTSTANPSQFGQPVTFNVNITSAYTATPISGTVTISDGKTVLGTPTLTNGAASFAISTLTAGAHSITASFAGNSTFAAATSQALTQTVNLATTTITWPTPAGISYGTALSATQLNATVATAYAATVPGTFVYTPAAGTLLTAGSQTLSVAFTPTDAVNFKPATGSVTIAVGKTAPTITWPAPADVVAGTVLSATQLNATATGISGALPGTFAYTPTLGTVLTAGTQNLSVTFTPTDLTDYTTATASVPLNVIGLALTSLSTGSVKLGDPALNLTLTGTGFLPNSVVYVGATALTTTFVNPTTLTVTIPASNFLTVQTLQVTVNDPTQVQTSNALALLVGAPAATVTVNGPSTVAPAAQPNLTFTVAPYAVPITATLTLTFTPAPGLTTDGTILFPNGTTTTTFTIPANTTTIPPVPFQSGSVAGTITITLKLTAGGVDVTPTPAPTLVITSPPAAPGVAGVTLDRNGDTLTVTIQGYSNTRDIEQIHFHFVAASGQSLATSDLVIDGSALFGAWYANPASPTYGSTFHYIQVFNLDQAATVVGQVQVTLINSQGNSQTVSAQ